MFEKIPEKCVEELVEIKRKSAPLSSNDGNLVLNPPENLEMQPVSSVLQVNDNLYGGL